MISNSQGKLERFSYPHFYNRAGPNPESTESSFSINYWVSEFSLTSIHYLPFLRLLHALKLGLGFTFDITVIHKISRTIMNKCFCKGVKLKFRSSGKIVKPLFEDINFLSASTLGYVASVSLRGLTSGLLLLSDGVRNDNIFRLDCSHLAPEEQ